MQKLNVTDEILYEAILKKDPQFEGQFFVGVKTTGIFCRPVCRARKPKKENVEFFTTTEDALLHGYRPCKLCRPLEYAGEIPPDFRSLLREIERDPTAKISDFMIAQKGIEPSRIRRWFLKHHGMTFHAYQRLIRISAALKNIKKGDSVIEAALDSGYDSLSGFQYSFKKATKKSPKESGNINYLIFSRITTPLGPMITVGNDDGICLLEFTDRKMLETELKQIVHYFKAKIFPGTNKHIEKLKEQINEYFGGTRKNFDVPLVTPGTSFQKEAWRILHGIPYGKTRSYKDQAVSLGNSNAARAVAKANGCNRISIVIPCHRVIAENGNLTGYGGGLWRKQWLLNHEKSHCI
jgi:AraC family transcriptional regulator of adaptative response/methylated-DNA-[protein]-cysteine methyltransferase